MVNNFFVDRFDSELLELSVAKVVPLSSVERSFFDQTELFFAQENIRLVFCSVPCDVKLGLLLNEYKYYLVSSRIVYRATGSSSSHKYKNDDLLVTESYQYSGSDSFLSEITSDLAAVSHYAKDPFIGLEGALKVYSQWMKNTFLGYAQKVFVATDKQGRCAGVLSLRMVKDDLFIDLLGVHSSFRNKGIASVLLQQAYMYAESLKKSLCVATQVENIPANCFYQKNSFLVESVEHVYHKIITRK